MRQRRAVIVFILGVISIALLAGAMPRLVAETFPTGTQQPNTIENSESSDAKALLETLEVKGRAPKTGYSRDQFGDGWAMVNGCSTRHIILYRDLQEPVLDESCKVVAGTLNDPYSGEVIVYSARESSRIQIDHVVALSDAWQKGAQQLSPADRQRLANDPLELLAVSGKENQAKGDGDAATWLPTNKLFRCTYVTRQIEIKAKYELWVTAAEKEAMERVLQTLC